MKYKHILVKLPDDEQELGGKLQWHDHRINHLAGFDYSIKQYQPFEVDNRVVVSAEKTRRVTSDLGRNLIWRLKGHT